MSAETDKKTKEDITKPTEKPDIAFNVLEFIPKIGWLILASVLLVCLCYIV